LGGLNATLPSQGCAANAGKDQRLILFLLRPRVTLGKIIEKIVAFLGK
jgi:hypothetical protein